MGDGSTGQEAHEPPIAGQIRLVGGPEVFPSQLGTREGESLYLPVKTATLKLFLHADPQVDLGVWRRTNHRGRFTIRGRDLQRASERAGHTVELSELAMEVYAGTRAYVRVRRIDPGSDSLTTWRFTVGSFERPASDEDHYAHVRQDLGHEMTIDVPDTHYLSTPSFTGGGLSAAQPHSTWQAFYAQALIMAMRAWYWNDYYEARSEEVPEMPGIDVVYPTTLANYAPPDARMLLPARAFGTDGREFTPSVVCHEFGHALYWSTGPEQSADSGGGAHGFVDRSLRPDWLERSENREQFLAQINLDFIEGYASFLGQTFLGETDYVESEYASFDLEHVGQFGSESGTDPGEQVPSGDYRRCLRGYGDWCTASYLWDLVDRGRERGDRLSLPWGTVHAHFRAFARANPGELLNLPMFHDYLKAHESRHARQLDELLETNHLRAVYDHWKDA